MFGPCPPARALIETDIAELSVEYLSENTAALTVLDVDVVRMHAKANSLHLVQVRHRTDGKYFHGARKTVNDRKETSGLILDS